jgi:hypothetical protein
MPVSQLAALRNKKNGVTVLTPYFNDPKTYLEFQAAGDPGGGDVQYISEELAASPAIVKAIQHGILELEEDTMSPEVAQAFAQQMRVAQQQRERADAKIAETIDRPENRDLVGESCVGPGERQGARCSASVPMREKAMSDVAPLCSKHAHLAMEYTRVEDNSYNEDGTSKKGYKWFRTTIEERQREQM